MGASPFSSDRYNRPGAEALRDGISSGPLVVQGPVGSLLMGELDGADIPAALWNIAEPQVVERLHALYRASGAQVLITNTFQASGPALERDGVRRGVAEVNRAAVDCARRAGRALLLGSIGPCGLSWLLEDSPDYRAARDAYRVQAHALLDAGADGLLLETFTSLRDLQPALAGVLDVADGMPFLVSFAIDGVCALLGDGLDIEAAAMYAVRAGAAAVGVNCCGIPESILAVRRISAAVEVPVMVRPHAGLPTADAEGAPSWNEDPAAFGDCVSRWLDAGASLLGTCCGATPRSTCAISNSLG